MKICVYDFDNTLIAENSLRSFVLFLMANTEGSYFFRIHRYLFFRIGLFYVVRLKKKSKTEYLVKQLSGYRKEELIELGIKYVREAMVYNDQLVKELVSDRKSGLNPYIISGSIEELIVPAAEHLDVVNFRCSSLKYDGEICMGYLAKDIRGKKSEAIDQIIATNTKVNLAQSKFVSDNIEDIPCAGRFGIIVGVVLNKSGKRAWEMVTPNLIEIDRGIVLNSKHIYLPGYYFITVRSNWYILFFYRILFPALIVSAASQPDTAFLAFLSWMAFIILYEVGYIDNDFYAVRKEEDPSIRLSSSQAEQDVIIYIALRIGYFCAVAYIMSALYGIHVAKVVLGVAWLNLAIYIGHNRLARKDRMVTYSILKASHLYIPVVAIPGVAEVLVGIALFYLPLTMIAYGKKVGLLTPNSRLLHRIVLIIQAAVLIGMYFHGDESSIQIAKIGMFFLALGLITIIFKKINKIRMSYH